MADGAEQDECAVGDHADVDRLREAAERLLGDDQAERAHVERASGGADRRCRKRLVEQQQSHREPDDGRHDRQMFQLTRDVARTGERNAREDGARAVGVEAAGESVRAMRRDEQQDDDEEVECDGGREEHERAHPDRIDRDAGQRQTGAELMRPGGKLALPNQLPGQHTSR